MSKLDQLVVARAGARGVPTYGGRGGLRCCHADQVAGRSGLELMQAMLRGELPIAPIARTLDFQLIEVDDGRAVFQGTPGPAHLNPMGTVHGGWYATLLDSALGCAVHTRCRRAAPTRRRNWA